MDCEHICDDLINELENAKKITNDRRRTHIYIIYKRIKYDECTDS